MDKLFGWNECCLNRCLLGLCLTGVIFILMTKAVCAAESVDKPKGVYASVVTGRAVTNKLMRGGLIRIPWAELEPSPGIFNFTLIEERLELLPEGMNWTLAVHGGWTSKEGGQADVLNPKGVVSRPGKPGGALARTALSPPWLVTEFKVKTFSMSFRGKPVQMPLYWDPVVQERLKSMLQALGEKYASDSRLKLVYVPQMSSNGTEGHFNGVSRETLLLAAGIDPDKKDAENLFADLWVAAGVRDDQKRYGGVSPAGGRLRSSRNIPQHENSGRLDESVSGRSGI